MKNLRSISDLFRTSRTSFFIAGCLMMALSSGLMVHPASGQSATPVASACQAPTPVAEPAFPPLATGVPATPGAGTPVPGAGMPVDPATIAAIDATALAVAACLTANDVETTLLLTTERYLGRAYGGGDRLSDDDYRLLASSGPVLPVEIRSIQNLQFSGMRTVQADVTFVEGRQLIVEEWTFLFEPTPIASSDGTGNIGTPQPVTGVWLLHDAAEIETGDFAGASRIPVTIRENSITLPIQPIVGPDIILAGNNAGEEVHELLVIRLEGGATTADLLQPSETFPLGIEILGQLTLAPGASGSMTLVGLEPGTYTIVCLFPDSSGVPHLALGEEATFTVS